MSYAQELKRFEKLQKKYKRDLKWKSKKEELLYYMGISPKEKLEWLGQIQQFLNSVSLRNRKIFLEKLGMDR